MRAAMSPRASERAPLRRSMASACASPRSPGSPGRVETSSHPRKQWRSRRLSCAVACASALRVQGPGGCLYWECVHLTNVRVSGVAPQSPSYITPPARTSTPLASPHPSLCDLEVIFYRYPKQYCTKKLPSCLVFPFSLRRRRPASTSSRLACKRRSRHPTASDES